MIRSLTTHRFLAPVLLVFLAGTARAQDKVPYRAADPASAVLQPSSWLRPVASLMVPGSGQILAGEDRGVVYLAAEALFVVRLLAYALETSRSTDRYRDLAFSVARGPFAAEVRDTVWDYFEQLEKYIESGPFDTDPGPVLQPPTDERSFNGSIWALARRTFLSDPDSIPDPDSEEYQRALEFYRERAVGPNFQWSWRNAGLEQDLYRQSVRQSDEAFRRVTQHLGLLLANHLLGAIDAFASVRAARNHLPLAVHVGAWPAERGSGSSWWVMASIRF